MTFVHGKNTYISLGATELSTFVNTSNIQRTADSHDVTTHGSDSHKFAGGLLGGTATMSGIYDNSTSSGPRAVIEPKLGTVVTLVRRPEGTGSGRPQDSVSVLVTQYTETNPVNDMVTWECQMQLSGDVTSTTQTS